MPDHEPFHEGEIAVQERTGERPVALGRGRLIRDTIAPPARTFLAEQCLIALGAVDELGRPWASLWFGLPGFVASVDGNTVRVKEHAAERDDPVSRVLATGKGIGLLAIDLGTRKRLRVNGVLTAMETHALEIRVRETFPNCAKYIQKREIVAAPPIESGMGVAHGERLGSDQLATVASADTLFVASHHAGRGVDVSHRGGEPGFVRVLDDRTLRVPDYAGNGMFQTLGNFFVEPRAGVLIADFARQQLLSLSGDVSVVYDQENAEHTSGGTGRYWDLSVQAYTQFPMRAGFAFRLIEPSPHNPRSTGTTP